MVFTLGQTHAPDHGAPRASMKALLFYQNDILAALVGGQGCQRLVCGQGWVWAQSSGSSAPAVAWLMQADRSASVLMARNRYLEQAMAYAPYGHLAEDAAVTSLGFNGQWREPSLEGYLMGNGYRLYQPRLMRFYSPDRQSPFGDGGVNCYCYCSGDPVNHVDPTGRMRHVLFQRVAGIQPVQPGKSTVKVSSQGVELDLLPKDIVTVAKSATVARAKDVLSIRFSLGAIEALEHSNVTLNHQGFSISVPMSDVGKVLVNSSPLGPPENAGGIKVVLPLNSMTHIGSNGAVPVVTVPFSQVASIGKYVVKALVKEKARNIRSNLFPK